MKLSSTQLEAFYAVAQSRNFTKAAALIHLTQSALSQRILNLESELQTTLFIRDRAGLELTEAAQELLRYCQLQKSFETEFLGKLKSKKRGELVGVIRIAGYSSVMRSVVLPTIKPLLTKNLGVRILLQTREVHELLPLLKSGEADYIVTDHEIQRDEIESVTIGEERNVLIEADGAKVADVYLDHDEKDETTLRYLRQAKMSSKGMSRHYLDDIYGIIDGVKLGLGRAVVPAHLIDAIKGVHIKNEKIVLKNPVALSFYKQPFYSDLHQSFTAELVKNARALL